MSKVQVPQYEIRIQGHLAPRRLDCFENLAITHHPDGETHLVATCRDQSALHGLLNHLHNLGVVLLSVHLLTCPRGGQGTRGGDCQANPAIRERHLGDACEE